MHKNANGHLNLTKEDIQSSMGHSNILYGDVQTPSKGVFKHLLHIQMSPRGRSNVG